MNPLRLLVRNVALLWLVIVALLALLWVVHRRQPAPLIPPAVQKSLDSLRATKAHDDSTIHALRAWGDAAITKGDSAASRARVYEAAAARIGSRADAYANEARRTDPAAIPGAPPGTSHADSTALLWKMAYEERTYERDTLALALKASQAAADANRVAADRFRQGLDESENRRTALEHLNVGLADALTKASRGCRVLWMPCPSRTAAAITGAVIGAVSVTAIASKM
jgi:hypothetical protein